MLTKLVASRLHTHITRTMCGWTSSGSGLCPGVVCICNRVSLFHDVDRRCDGSVNGFLCVCVCVCWLILASNGICLNEPWSEDGCDVRHALLSNPPCTGGGGGCNAPWCICCSHFPYMAAERNDMIIIIMQN